MQRHNRWSAWGVVLFAFAGCSSEDSLGTKDGQANAAQLAGNPCQLPDPPPAAGGSGGGSGITDPLLVGRWAGSLDESVLASDSRTIELTITDGVPSGVAVFGDAPPPAPPTEAGSSYPPYDTSGAAGSAAYVPHEGFAYAIRDAAIVAGRMHFTLSSQELWSDWCSVQTSYSWPDTCSCLPNWGAGVEDGVAYQPHPSTGQIVERSMAQISLCVIRYGASSPCNCTVSGCVARRDRNVIFDLIRHEDQLDGTLVVVNTSLGDQVLRSVHLTRQ